MKRAIEQVIGREGAGSYSLKTCVVNFSLRVAGFVPRQLNRSMASLKLNLAPLFALSLNLLCGVRVGRE
jgi:hypothetical protein